MCLFKEEEDRQIGDSRIKRELDRLATLSILTVRVEALEYSILVCEFGGLENVLRDASVRAIPI